MTIKDINIPIELYFLQEGLEPMYVVSFLTTALFTLKQLYPHATYQYIHIENHKFLKNHQAIEGIYSTLKGLGLEELTY